MIIIRKYQESDAPRVGRLIADTYSAFNLGFASPEEQERLLGPFRHARSPEPAHQEEIARVIRATLDAIPFNTAMGYKKTTGVRAGRSFDGTGLRYQPMKKVLQPAVASGAG